MKLAIAGIHTGIGKTICSAIIAEALGADYWKPVQAGLEEPDSALLRTLLTNGEQRVHPEVVRLQQPISPHAAAAIDGIEIDYTKFTCPETVHPLIVETAGGILSPISATKTMADFIKDMNMPALLVSQNYLGSINHTLASVEVMKARGINLLGIIVNGHTNKASEEFIVEYSGTPIIARVPHFEEFNVRSISESAERIKDSILALNLGSTNI